MAFIVTGLYALALFLIGVFFVRRGKKEAREKEDHCSALAWNGTERRSGRERRRGADRRSPDAALSRS